MGKIEKIRDENFNLLDLINEKERDYEIRELKEDVTWGNRGEILTIGKTMDKVLFHRREKSIVSARKQIELMYGWFLKCEDRRTRAIGKAWFEEKEGLFDSVKEHPMFSDFLGDLKESDTWYKYHQRFYTYQKALRIMKQITEGRESQYILTNPVYSLPHEMKYNYRK